MLGGTGFAGRGVVAELAAAGIAVEAFSRRTGCDLLDELGALTSLRRFRPTHLVNCAGMTGGMHYLDTRAAEVLDANARLVLNVYRLAEQLAPVLTINLVASCVYPGAIELHDEVRLWDGPLHPSVQSFGEAHRLLLALADCHRRQKGIQSVNLVAPNMYGPHDSTDPRKTKALNALVLRFMRAVRDGAQEVEVWGTGRPVREWLFVRDMARVVRLTIESAAPPPAAPLNIAQRHGLSVMELVDLIRTAVGYEGSVVYNTSYADGVATRVMHDASFRSRFSGFTFTPLPEGLRATIDYYRSVLDAEDVASSSAC